MRLFLYLTLMLVWNCGVTQITYFTIEKLENDQRRFSEGARITHHNIEETIIANPATDVVDRETFLDIEAERERQKSESFIDGNYVEQGKSSGAQYIIFPKYTSASRILQIKIVDVTTSSTAYTKEYPLSHFVEKSGDISRPEYYARFINEITEEFLKEFTNDVMTVKLVSIDKQDRGVAKEALIYCPNDCKLKTKTALQLFHKRAIPETPLFRYIKIAEAKVKNDEANGLYLITIKKGGDTVLALNQEKQEIYAKLKS